MDLKEYLEYKKKNPENTSDFLFSIGKTIKNIRPDKPHNLIRNICLKQSTNYKAGIQEVKTENKDLKIFIS